MVANYDLAVVGAGLGGLAAAALASSQKKKVIVLDPEDGPGGVVRTARKNDFVFIPSDLSFGFDRGGEVQSFLDLIQISHRTSLHSPCFQIALPGRRITIYAEQGETLEELRREFPNEIDRIAMLYRDVRREAERRAKGDFRRFWSRLKSARPFIARRSFSPEFIAFLDVQSRFFFNQPALDLSLTSLISLCDSVPVIVHGGFGSVARKIAEFIMRNGGDVKYRVPFSGVSIKKGRRPAISLADSTIEAGSLLLNIDRSRARSLYFIGIRDNLVPIGMLEHVLCLTDFSRPERFFSLSLSEKDDKTAAPPGMRSLAVSFSSYGDAAGEERMDDVASLIPFMKDFLIFSEEIVPGSRHFTTAGGISFKSLRTRDKQTVLSRSSQKGVYMLDDGAVNPVQAITAGQTFVKRIL